MTDGTRLQTFTLTGYHGHTPGTVTIRTFDRSQRVRRAVGALGKWWGIAVLTVFIPVAHFVLVPSFLGFGVWQFFQRLRTVELAAGARGRCPDCGMEQRLDLAQRWQTPQSVTCKHCSRGLQLTSV